VEVSQFLVALEQGLEAATVSRHLQQRNRPASEDDLWLARPFPISRCLSRVLEPAEVCGRYNPGLVTQRLRGEITVCHCR
jgi:hypothetical protein